MQESLVLSPVTSPLEDHVPSHCLELYLLWAAVSLAVGRGVSSAATVHLAGSVPASVAVELLQCDTASHSCEFLESTLNLRICGCGFHEPQRPAQGTWWGNP